MSPETVPGSAAAEFHARRARWSALVAAGDFEPALTLVEGALDWARQSHCRDAVPVLEARLARPLG